MIELYSDCAKILCESCGVDVLENNGIVVFATDKDGRITKVYACCRGKCDEFLEKTYVGNNEITGWKGIDDLKNPYLFLKNIMALINNLHAGKMIEYEALKKYQDIILACAQYVLREPTQEEKESAIREEMLGIF